MVITTQTIIRNYLIDSILTSYDRGAIEKLVNSLQKIADIMTVSKSTIYYELQRVKHYQTLFFQQDVKIKRKHCVCTFVLNVANKILIENHLFLASENCNAFQRQKRDGRHFSC